MRHTGNLFQRATDDGKKDLSRDFNLVVSWVINCGFCRVLYTDGAWQGWNELMQIICRHKTIFYFKEQLQTWLVRDEPANFPIPGEPILSHFRLISLLHYTHLPLYAEHVRVVWSSTWSSCQKITEPYSREGLIHTFIKLWHLLNIEIHSISIE